MRTKWRTRAENCVAREQVSHESLRETVWLPPQQPQFFQLQIAELISANALAVGKRKNTIIPNRYRSHVLYANVAATEVHVLK